MAQCITCGSDLHPERAAKYNYCMAPDCQRKNLKGLELVAVGVNKAAEQYLLLDQRTKDDLATGRYADQRRGSFGTSLPSAAPARSPAVSSAASPAASPAVSSAASPAKATPARPAPRRPAPRRELPKPWTSRQERLALLYNEQGQRPDEIAGKLSLSPYQVTQIILSSRNRGKL